MGSRRQFKRKPATRSYRRMFILATEGAETEPQYFDLFNNQNTVIHVKCLKGRTKSSPDKVLERMKKHLEKSDLRSEDQAWLVVDKDQWTEEQLQRLLDWSQAAQQHGLAVSNPKFELWLLLHFEEGNGIANSADCSRRLVKCLPNFAKGDVDVRKLEENIERAIERAKRKDVPPCHDWPRHTGTTVYRLVENILFMRS